MKGAGRFRAVVGEPLVDEARLALYRRWHAFREGARDWSPMDIDPEGYFMSFAFPHPSVREIAYYDDEAPRRPRLVGIGICDETPNAMSAVYFYYDPDYARFSPGVVNVLFQIELSASRGLDHVYLGYYVEGCPSMRYKATFRPNERLAGFPEPDEEPRWIASP